MTDGFTAGMPPGTKAWKVGHSLSSACCWWQQSVEVEKEEWSSSDQTTYTCPMAGRKIIDFVTPSRFYGRRMILAEYGGDPAYLYLIPKVYVNDVEQPSGYTINFDDAELVFDSALNPSDVVEVSYRYGQSSTYKVTAPAGKEPPKRLRVTDAELQWTEDIEVDDAMIVELWGMIPGDVYGFPGIMIGPVPLVQFPYDSIMDIYEEARQHYSPISPVNGPRGCPQIWHDLKWDYSMGELGGDEQTSTILYPLDWATAHYAPKYGQEYWATEMRISLENSKAFGGTRCSFTLYGFTEPINKWVEY